jgi:5'-phosphate synthase pdxT subunit
VYELKVGVIGVQGAVSEHLEMLKKCSCESVWIRKLHQLETVNALILPGGESTTISRLLNESGMFGRVQELGNQGMPVFGTCAGLVLLAKKGCEQVERTGQELLGLMDMKISRNAFGSQRESFEVELDLERIARYTAVFIRAPTIEKTWASCKPIAKYEEKIVAAMQDNLLATSFHPELTEDTRIHQFFLDMI